MVDICTVSTSGLLLQPFDPISQHQLLSNLKLHRSTALVFAYTDLACSKTRWLSARQIICRPVIAFCKEEKHACE